MVFRRPVLAGIAAVAAAAGFGGCAEVDSFQPEQVIPPDYRSTFVQVRGCRSSTEHAFAHIVVRTSPATAAIYDDGPLPFPQGTVIVKEEYADSRCTQLNGYTAMKKDKPGADPAAGDWRWYRIDMYDRIEKSGAAAAKECAGCHGNRCGGEMHEARDFTCTLP